jgi:hypothetical protein
MITTVNRAKKLLQLMDDSLDDQINILIPMVEQDYINIRGKAFEVDEYGNTKYPNGSELTAIRMIQHHLKRDPSLRAEKLGEYSYSRGEKDLKLIMGYPDTVVGSIKRVVIFE